MCPTFMLNSLSRLFFTNLLTEGQLPFRSGRDLKHPLRERIVLDRARRRHWHCRLVAALVVIVLSEGVFIANIVKLERKYF